MGTSSSISQGDSDDKGVAVTSQGDREDKGVASPLREGTEGKKKRPIDSQKQSADIICTERSKTVSNSSVKSKLSSSPWLLEFHQHSPFAKHMNLYNAN